MCKVSVTCCCSGGGGGGGDLMTLGFLIVLAVVAGPTATVLIGATISIASAVLAGLAVSAGIVTGGWVVKSIASQVIDQVALNRHNRRMAEIHPHVAQALGYAPRELHMPAIEGRRLVHAEVVGINRGGGDA